MPIYEYLCKNCGRHTEKMQKVSDAPLTVCDECGGELEKQWSLSGFQFKGAGWYVTDYAGKKADKAAPKTEKSSDTQSTATSDAASKDSGSDKKSGPES
jgi:putative FmdB family regulatory protein